MRRNIFWFIDRILGRRVSDHMREISHILGSSKRSEQNLLIDENLTKLLIHASDTVLYYKKFSNQESLVDFPVLNKEIIRQNLSLFLSNKYNSEDLIPVVTSGSTGTPFKVFHDKNKRYRNNADTIYYAGLAGYQLGHRLIYMKIWAKQKTNNPVHFWMQNIWPVDVIHLNEVQMHNMIKKLEKTKATFGFLGYASAMDELCKYLDKTRNGYKINSNVKSIISMSESLNDYTRKTMSKYFGAPMVSRYSNLENGIIAQQLLNSKGQYLVNTASYFLEILKLNTDELAETGEIGRIVITDLFNYAMPMIRYDTGDLGAIAIDPVQPEKMFLSTVEGRKLDQLYDTKGNHVSSYIMYKNMWQYTEIDQYQLIQYGEKEYIFKINIKGDFAREDQLKKEFISYLGEDAIFKIEYVKEIPLLSSGKRQKVVNNYIKNEAIY